MEEESLYSSFLLMAKDLLYNNLDPLDVHGEGKEGLKIGLWAVTEAGRDWHLPG